MDSIFKDSAVKKIIDTAKYLAIQQAAQEGRESMLTMQHVEQAIMANGDAACILKDFFELLPEHLVGTVMESNATERCNDVTPEKIPYDEKIEALLSRYRRYAESLSPGQGELPAFHSPWLSAFVRAFISCRFPQLEHEISSWCAPSEQTDIFAIRKKVSDLGNQLRDVVIGQEHVIRTVEKSLFSMFMNMIGNEKRGGPGTFFLFAGPPGTGKTLLARHMAGILGRPFKRFDLNAYSGPYEHEALIGSPKIFSKAAEGQLTGFVLKHPDAVLLFDEVDRAHPNIVKLFLQVIDEGYLTDHYLEQDVFFAGTLVIFTTNAGRSLYHDLNYAPFLKTFPDIQRAVLLDTLANETLASGEKVFPAALCSRFRKGNVLLFNKIGPYELLKIARKEAASISQACSSRFGKKVVIADEVLTCLILHEGGDVDARSIGPKVERFVMDALFVQGSSLLDEEWKSLDRIVFCIDVEHEKEKFDRIFHRDIEPVVCVISDKVEIITNIKEFLVSDESDNKLRVKFVYVENFEHFNELINNRNTDDGTVNMVILDLALGDVSDHDDTILKMDSRPQSPRYQNGFKVLEKLALHRPDIPVILYLPPAGSAQGHDKWEQEIIQQCAEIGSVRDVISIDLADHGLVQEHSNEIRLLIKKYLGNIEAIYRRYKRAQLVLRYGLSPKIVGNQLKIRLGQFEDATAWKARSLRRAIHPLIRPDVEFRNIVGQQHAVNILNRFAYIISHWSENLNRENKSLPRGILLSGPPGTGKTLLAKAFSNEANAPFFNVSASCLFSSEREIASENVKEIFDDAREYAPSIIFIDEIDAIGCSRKSNGSAESASLNELLIQMDGFSSGFYPPVIVLAATNHPELLDSALLRRFDLNLRLTDPDVEERGHFIAQYFPECATDEIKKKTAGFSYSDLERVIKLAGIFTGSRNKVKCDDILNALDIYKSGIIEVSRE